MGIEIERKFLVVGDGWREEAARVVRMAQGYLNDAESVASGHQRASVRVRIADQQAFLNIKSRELGHTRQEFDYEVPLADAQALLALCVGGLVDKHRHHVHVGTHLWEIDEFLGDNTGLVVAEVELDHADEDFQRPAWLGREVTDDARFYNLALASRPYSAWSATEKN